MAEFRVGIVIHACGFDSKEKVCRAFRSRIRRAKKFIEDPANFLPNDPKQIAIIITGGVPFEPKSKLLAHCAGEYFNQLYPSRKSPHEVFYAINCFNSSTDAKRVLAIARYHKIRKLYIISSFWHNWLLKEAYKFWLKTHYDNVKLRFIEAKRDKAGVKTIIKYFVSGMIMRLAAWSGNFSQLDIFLSKKQEKRLISFQEIGCD